MTNSNQITLSVIMPAYNESAAIADAVSEVQHWVLAPLPAAELIVVNDGSQDDTGKILEGLASGEPRLRVVNQKNAGHGAAVRTGLELARGEYVFLLDSDRQVPLEAFPGLWQAAHGHEGALGVRWPRRDPLFRLLLTRVVRLLLFLLFRVRLRDANCPFKIFRRSIWTEARGLIPEGTITPSLFLAVYMARRWPSIEQQPVPHRIRATGVVSIRRWKLVKTCALAFRQLWDFRKKLRI
ncbi:MAG: glycosyltransferase family 2 protein [Verrucomicrobiia bacterium]|jgi:glycosyltransferase involved in cell wall biosynthesis